MLTLFRPDTENQYDLAQKDHPKIPQGLLLKPALHQSRLDRAAQLIQRAKPESMWDIGSGYGDLVSRLPPELTEHYVGMEANTSIFTEAVSRHLTVRFVLTDLESAGVPVKPAVLSLVASLGLACHLHPHIDALRGFANLLQAYAHRHIVLEIQEKGVYKGDFTAFSIEDVQVAFCQRVRPENVLRDENDSTATILLPLRP